MDRMKDTRGAWSDGRRVSSSSSSDDSQVLPSVRLLASKFGGIGRSNQQQTQPRQPQHKSMPSLANVGVQKSTITVTKDTSGNRNFSVQRAQVHITASKTNSVPRDKNILTNGNIDDEVFYKNDVVKMNGATPNYKTAGSATKTMSDGPSFTKKWSGSSIPVSKPPASRSYSEDTTLSVESSMSSASSYADSQNHNVIFGVPLRRLHTISWGVMQKRIVSTSSSSSSSDDDSDSESHRTGYSPSPMSPSPFSPGLTSPSPLSPSPSGVGNKFGTFPKTSIPSQSMYTKSNTLDKKKGGGVKGKVTAQKLGDRSSIRYGSQSDLSTATLASATTWRRKSVSDDMYELSHHQPLTRRQSISDLLKLYRTKSQTDLSQASDNKTFTQNKAVPKDEPQIKPANVSNVAAPLKMSDLKIVNLMTKPKVEPYKLPTKDIIRLPASQSQSIYKKTPIISNIVIQAKPLLQQTNSNTSISPDSDAGARPKIAAKPQQQQVEIVYRKPANAIPIATKPIDKGTKPKVQENTPRDSVDSTTKLTRMLTPSPYTKYSESSTTSAIKSRLVSKTSSSSSSSSSSSEDERDVKITKSSTNTTAAAAPPYRSNVVAMISSLNKNVSKPFYPNRHVPEMKAKSPRASVIQTDGTDGIPHDDKVPSFITTQPPKKSVTVTKVSVKPKDEPALVVSKVTLKNTDQSSQRKKSSVEDESDGIPHDDKVASYIVTRPPKTITPIKSPEVHEKPVKKAVQISAVVKSWPPEPKVRSDSSSSDSTIKDVEQTKSPAPILTAIPASSASWREKANDMFKSDTSSSDSSDEEEDGVFVKGKTGVYVVNKEPAPHATIKDRFIERVSRKSSSDSSSDEALKKRVSSTPAQAEPTQPKQTQPKPQATKPIEPKPTQTTPIQPKPTPSKPTLIPTPTARPEKPVQLILRRESLDSFVNVRPETKTSVIKVQTSNVKDTTLKPSKLPSYSNNVFPRKSSTSEDETKANSTKHATVVKTVGAKPATKIPSPKRDRSDEADGVPQAPEERRGSNTSNSESFKDFDPYAIGRMIVRGSRKSNSFVKKPENLTNIRNATIPSNSPFSPLKPSTAIKAGVATTVQEEEDQPRRKSSASSSSSSSSSSEDDESLSFLTSPEQDGVYSATSITITD